MARRMAGVRAGSAVWAKAGKGRKKRIDPDDEAVSPARG
jgi:hypothetical protein